MAAVEMRLAHYTLIMTTIVKTQRQIRQSKLDNSSHEWLQDKAWVVIEMHNFKFLINIAKIMSSFHVVDSIGTFQINLNINY